MSVISFRVSCHIAMLLIIVTASFAELDTTTRSQPRDNGSAPDNDESPPDNVDGLPDKSEEASMMEYLTKYQYLGSHSPDVQQRLITKDSYTQALKDFQKMVGIPQTGKADEATIRKRKVPRCGLPDKESDEETSTRKKRYVLHRSSHRRFPVSYKVSRYDSRLSSTDTDADLARAFKLWSDVSGISFNKVSASRRATIDVAFESGDHGDNYPFDGPSGTLAHAFFPSSGGDMHFDAAERWSSGVSYDTNFFQVAAHEIGHAIGLEHSENYDSVMAPLYSGYDPNFSLHRDDIRGAQAHYGVNTNYVDTETTSEAPSTTVARLPNIPQADDDDMIVNFDYCGDSRINAMTYTARHGTTFAFRGSMVYTLGTSGLVGEPRPMSEVFPGLPNNIDNAVYAPNRKTYFFKDHQVWQYDSRGRVSGPYSRSYYFPGLASLRYIDDDTRFDAVFVWSGRRNAIYFFYGHQYFRYDTNTDSVLSSYPRSTSAWANLRFAVDTAYLHPRYGKTYFFKNDNYYRFNDISFNWDVGYPRSVSELWYRCSNSNLEDGPAEINFEEGSLPYEGDDLVRDTNIESDLDDLEVLPIDREQNEVYGMLPRDDPTGEYNGASNMKCSVAIITLVLAICTVW